MKLPVIIENIRLLISKNLIDEAIQELKNVLDKSSRLDELITHSARYNELKKQIRLGTINHQDESISSNQIIKGLLDLVKDIEELGLNEPNNTFQDDFDDYKPLHFSIQQHIGQGDNIRGDKYMIGNNIPLTLLEMLYQNKDNDNISYEQLRNIIDLVEDIKKKDEGVGIKKKDGDDTEKIIFEKLKLLENELNKKTNTITEKLDTLPVKNYKNYKYLFWGIILLIAILIITNFDWLNRFIIETQFKTEIYFDSDTEDELTDYKFNQGIEKYVREINDSISKLNSNKIFISLNTFENNINSELQNNIFSIYEEKILFEITSEENTGNQTGNYLNENYQVKKKLIQTPSPYENPSPQEKHHTPMIKFEGILGASFFKSKDYTLTPLTLKTGRYYLKKYNGELLFLDILKIKRIYPNNIMEFKEAEWSFVYGEDYTNRYWIKNKYVFGYYGLLLQYGKL